MRILILGGDGYLGWPTAMHLAALGHNVSVMDNYSKRKIAKETNSQSLICTPKLDKRAQIFREITRFDIKVYNGDCANYNELAEIVTEFMPEAIVHYAEQASAPYSMMGVKEAGFTLNNNLNSTFNLIWALINIVPDCHLVKLGTMGEYGTPNIDIEEGWIEIEKNNRKDTFLFPRQAGSFYHTTKVLDTDMLWFYVRLYNLRVTDLMQGPVYGIHTAESQYNNNLMTSFHYDDIFGTVLNRFVTQAVANLPLSVYGKGGQTRGFLNIIDTLHCVNLAIQNPVDAGELRILNQFTEEFTVLQLAEMVHDAALQVGIKTTINKISNPRKEKEEHYYKASNTGLHELGLEPTYLTSNILCEMLTTIIKYKDKIQQELIMPRVSWQ